ncbi:hypothetical protein MRX96_011720 [Rhipicephalus microplus]
MHPPSVSFRPAFYPPPPVFPPLYPTRPLTKVHRWRAARHGKKPVRENETAGGETRAKFPLAGATHTSLRSTANPPRGWPSPRAHARPGVNEAGAAVIHIAASVPFHSPCRTERGPRQPATARKNRLAAARQVHFFRRAAHPPVLLPDYFLVFPRFSSPPSGSQDSHPGRSALLPSRSSAAAIRTPCLFIRRACAHRIRKTLNAR